MSAEDFEGRAIEAEVFWEQLVELEDGSISPIEREKLMTLLNESEAARHLYAEFFMHSEGLAAEARFLDEQGRLPIFSDSDRSSQLFMRSLLVAAAVLILGAIVASLIMLKTPNTPLFSATSTADAKWAINDVEQDTNTDELTVAAGSTVRITSGTLKLHLESGTTMVLQGPARVSFPELSKPVLESGWLWIDSGDTNESFEVSTPGLLVRDIGTRFGVRVPDQGPTEVHLIEGKIEILERASGELITAFEPKQGGLGIPLLGEPMTIPLARDPFPELDQLLADKANYTTTIRSQNPTGYWKLDLPDQANLANEISGGITGGRHEKIQISQSGLTPSAGFHGFQNSNLAANLSGKLGHTAISLGVTPVHEGILFSDDFSGGITPLHGTTPNQTTRNTKWVSSRFFQADGTITQGPGSATLAFEPLDGCRYTLDASFNGIRGSGDQWLAIGFANGQSSDNSHTNRFVEGSPEGRAWMLIRNINATIHNMAHTRGIGDAVPWTSTHAQTTGEDFDLRIVLDTTKGAGSWTATWFAKKTNDPQYTCVRPASPLISEMIGSIGIAASGSDITGAISHFSLRAEQMPGVTSGHHLADGRAQLARREGALSFWVRCQKQPGQRAILCAAGDDPSDDSLHASVEADGRIAFFMENGRYDVLMTSQKSITDDRWHHLVLSWSPTSVDLYLDGKRVARDNEGRAMQQGILTELRFGSGPNGTKSAPFQGSLDEIALWDRPLEAAEVLHQFQSAKGSE